MNDIEKMLESLSKADINYRDRINIDVCEENMYSENEISNEKYSVEPYKRSKLGFVPALVFSFIVIAGAGMYIKNIRNTAPLVNSSSDETAFEVPVSEEKDNTEFSDPDSETSDEILVKSVFSEIEVPKTMNFIRGFMSYGSRIYTIDDPEKCEYIFTLLSESCIEKTDKFKVDLYGSEVSVDVDSGEFPYTFSYNDGDVEIRPEQIKFIIPDSDTEIVVFDGNNIYNFLLVRENGNVNYYRTEGNVFRTISSITEDIADAVNSGKSHYSLKDDKGNNIPVSEDITLKHISAQSLDCLLSFDLSDTEYRDIPCGGYEALNVNIYANGKSDEFIEIPTKNFKIGVYEEKGKRILNILVIAETVSWDSDGFDLTGCTLNAGFDGIVLKDNDEYSYPLKFEFEFKYDNT